MKKSKNNFFIIFIISVNFILANSLYCYAYNNSDYVNIPKEFETEQWHYENEKSKFIGSGFDCDDVYKNRIFPTSHSSFKKFGANTMSPYYAGGEKKEKWTTFNLGKIDKNKEIGIWAKNFKIWDKDKEAYEKIDIKMTFSGWKEAENYKRKFGPILSIRHLQVPCFRMSGLKNITLKQEFFLSGTNKPVNINSNTTYKDVDDMQSVEILSGCKDFKVYKDTYLQYRKNKKAFGFYNPIAGDMDTGDKKAAFGITFSTDKMIMRYGDYNVNPGEKDDIMTPQNIWKNNYCAYFSASSALAYRPVNHPPKVEAGKTLDGLIVSNSLVHMDFMDIKLFADFNDIDLDDLETHYKLYRDGRLIKTGKKNILRAGSRRFVNAPAKTGKYKIIWFAKEHRIKNPKSAQAHMDFIVKAPHEGSIMYSHTPNWNKKRKRYNRYYFGNKLFSNIMTLSRYTSENNRAKYNPKTDDNREVYKRIYGRANNVFWAGEKIKIRVNNLDGHTKDCKISVTVFFNKYKKETYRLSTVKHSNTSYEANIFKPQWIEKLGYDKPVKIVPEFQITEEYIYYIKRKKKPPIKKRYRREYKKTENERYIIVDSFREYNQNHRV